MGDTILMKKNQCFQNLPENLRNLKLSEWILGVLCCQIAFWKIFHDHAGDAMLFDIFNMTHDMLLVFVSGVIR